MGLWGKTFFAINVDETLGVNCSPVDVDWTLGVNFFTINVDETFGVKFSPVNVDGTLGFLSLKIVEMTKIP